MYLWFIIMSVLLIYFMIKELFNYSKLNDYILIHCGLYIIYIRICFNTFEAYFSYISHILTLFISS